MKKKILSIAVIAFVSVIGCCGLFPDNDLNVKALAQETKTSNGKVISHEVLPGPDGEPIHTYICVGDGICGH